MKTEKIVAVIFLIGIAFRLLHWDGGGIILTMAMMTLSMLYLAGGFYFFCDRNLRRQNLALSIIAGLVLSVVPLGILFKIMYWEGAGVMILTGLLATIPLLVVVLLLGSKATEELKTYYRNMRWRTAILAAFAVFFFLTPMAMLLKLEYWNDPQLARIKTQYYSHPENEEYKKQHDEYFLHKKMD